MGSIFLTVLLLSGLILMAIRHLIPQQMRLSIILLVTACIATLVDLLISAFYYEWHLTLGIYIPLLAMNCLILANAEENALQYGLKDVIAQTLISGLSIVGILFLVGLIRDVMSGLIFSDNGFILFEMAPGAFLVLGLIIALLNYLDMSKAKVSD
jgi:electron transport complex protein RnfE